MADLASLLNQLSSPEQRYGSSRLGPNAKGAGYFGPLMRPDTAQSTELEFDFENGGKRIYASLLVPTLNKQQLDHLLAGGQPTASIYENAVVHALRRLNEGKQTFAQPNEVYPLPREKVWPKKKARKSFSRRPANV